MISTIEKFRISNFLAYPPNSPPKNLLPYRRSFFQIHFFTILISESDSLQKSVCTKYLSFFDTITGTGSKMEKTGKLEGKFKKVRLFGNRAPLLDDRETKQNTFKVA